jgi:hypothetical protein
MSALVAALGLVSARAAAEQAVPVSADRAARATWQEGFMLVPMIGINSFQGDSSQGTGPGLRLGLLAGSRLTELLSLNVGFAFDLVNVDVPPGVSGGRYVADIGFNPLFHFQLQMLEIVAGPLAGVFVDYGSIGSAPASVDTWAYGRRERRRAVPGRPQGPPGCAGELLSPQCPQGLRDGERKGHVRLRRCRLGQDARAVIRDAALT